MKIGDIAKLVYKDVKPIDPSLKTTLGLITGIRWNEKKVREEHFIFYMHKRVNRYGGFWVPKFRLEIVS